MWPLSGKKIFEMIHDTSCSDVLMDNFMIEGIVTDSRLITNQTESIKNTQKTLPLLFIAIQGEKFDGHAYLQNCFENGVALALVNQNSPHLKNLSPQYLARCLKVDDVTTALRHFAKKFRETFSFPVIAIGGSNGKTTTKEILFSFLSFNKHKITKTQKSENGFLGVAFTILQKAHTHNNPPHALVLEIGIDEIGAMKKHVDVAKPNVVLLTALGPEHLTGLKNWETAAKEELILFSIKNTQRVWQLFDTKIAEFFANNIQNASFKKNMTRDVFIVPHAQKEKYHKIFAHTPELSQAIVLFWEIKEISPKSTTVYLLEESFNAQAIQIETKIPLPGAHNTANFALAFGTARAIGLTHENIQEGFKEFCPAPQRSNMIQFRDETVLFDDTYNASPSSVLAALDMLKLPEWNTKKKILVLGDMLELGDESKYWHESLFKHLKEMNHTRLFLVGPAMYNCYRLFEESDRNLFRDQKLDICWLDANTDPAHLLETLSADIKNSVILVKGSRGMRLERFVHCVENFFS